MKAPTASSEVWHGPGSGSRRLRWRNVLWALIYPHRQRRTGLTLSGLLLIVLSIAIGTAAYNSASNILFLTLSLLLGCVILSGVLSWLNFRGLSWRLESIPPFRVGHDHTVTLILRNQKRFLPSYGVWFDLRLVRSGEIKELALATRLDAGAETRLECAVRPTVRGREQLELIYVGSLFPFGFLRKGMAVEVVESFVVWPAPVEYRRYAVSAWQRRPSGELLRKAGQGGDLLSLRRYQRSDSHRQIHWKASARLRQLMVRQTAAESGQGFSLWVDTAGDRWNRPDQFELLCGLAATLAEDLFTDGKLRAAGVGEGALIPVRRLRDLELFLDRLALASPVEPAAPLGGAPRPSGEGVPTFPFRAHLRRNLLTFAPDGARGVTAYLHGERAATA